MGGEEVGGGGMARVGVGVRRVTYGRWQWRARVVDSLTDCTVYGLV